MTYEYFIPVVHCQLGSEDVFLCIIYLCTPFEFSGLICGRVRMEVAIFHNEVAKERAQGFRPLC